MTLPSNPRVLSLFDGIGCGLLALERAGLTPDAYYASEVDESAKTISNRHEVVEQLGDIRGWRDWGDLGGIDLILAGSPCQGFSSVGKRLDFSDPRSALFWVFVDILRFYKPKHFIFENVGSMSAEIRDAISKCLGCEPVRINSRLVSAQNRNRYYWVSAKIRTPTDRKILFSDILVDNYEKKYIYSDKVMRRIDCSSIICAGGAGYKEKGRELEKSPPIIARHHKGMQSYRYPVVKCAEGFRALTPIECERLQTLPDNYTAGFSKTTRFKLIGNGWTVEVIAHILKNIQKQQEWL